SDPSRPLDSSHVVSLIAASSSIRRRDLRVVDMGLCNSVSVDDVESAPRHPAVPQHRREGALVVEARSLRCGVATRRCAGRPRGERGGGGEPGGGRAASGGRGGGGEKVLASSGTGGNTSGSQG